MSATKKTLNLLANKYGHRIIIICIVLFFITDVLNVFAAYFPNYFESFFVSPFFRFSSYSKGLSLIGLIIINSFDSDFRRVYKWILIILGLSFIISVDLNNPYTFFVWIIRCSQLIFPFIIFRFLVKTDSNKLDYIHHFLRAIIAIQVLVVVFLFLSHSNLFLTYGKSRFGYLGLIYAQNDASFFYIIFIVLEYYAWKVKRSWIDFVLFIGVFITALLLGTKIIYLFLGLFVIFIGFELKVKIRYLFWLGMSVLFVGLIIVFYQNGFLVFYIKVIHKNGWLFMITSMRNELFMMSGAVIKSDWSLLNYLFGGITGRYTEMDIIDNFIYFGIIGSIAYYKLLFKELFYFSKENRTAWFFVVVFFVVGGLAGHVFASGVNAIYLAILCYYLQKNDPERLKNDKEMVIDVISR